MPIRFKSTKNIILFLLIALTFFGCQKKERKLDVVVATPEDEAAVERAKIQKTLTQKETIPEIPLPPMVVSMPVYPPALANHLPKPPKGSNYSKTFYVYADKNFSSNHFIPSGWMGDYLDLSIATDSTENPYSGSTCIKIIYKNSASNGARWAGMYWQDPSNNWGTYTSGGFDLTGKTRLTFWARGEKGGERIEEFKVGGIKGVYPDSDSAKIGPISLAIHWKQYAIDLKGKNLSHIIGGFAWSTNLKNNPNGCTFYLDEIKYE